MDEKLEGKDASQNLVFPMALEGKSRRPVAPKRNRLVQAPLHIGSRGEHKRLLMRHCKGQQRALAFPKLEGAARLAGAEMRLPSTPTPHRNGLGAGVHDCRSVR